MELGEEGSSLPHMIPQKNIIKKIMCNLFKSKLKAKHIAKLRKKAKLMQTYKVRECYGLFGFDDFRENDFTLVKAKTPYLAMQRYFKKYYLEMKQKHRFYNADVITTYNWGKIEVVDERGFKIYYH